MKNTLILYLFSVIFLLNTQKIVIKHKYLDRINISNIADEVLMFELSQKYINIRDLVISNNYLFISPGELANKGFSVSVSRINKLGENFKEIYRSKENKLIRGLAFDNEKNRLFIAHNKEIISIDASTNEIIKEIKTKKNVSKIKVFNNNLYVAGYHIMGESEIYYLDIYDLHDLKLIKTQKEMKYNDNERSFRNPTFSSNQHELFLSMGKVNEIYTSNDGFRKPIVVFENIYNNKPESGNILFSLNQGLIGKFAITSFKYLNSSYTFLYDMKSNIQYLSKKGQSSGLYDDIKNSGFHQLFLTNSNEYMFSYKKNKNGEISIFLFKIKS